MLIQQHHNVWMPKNQIVSSSSSSSSWWQHQLIITTCDVKIIASANKMKMQIVSQNENFLCCTEKKCKKIRIVSKLRILGKSHFSPSIPFHTTFSRLKSELFDFTRRLFFRWQMGDCHYISEKQSKHVFDETSNPSDIYMDFGLYYA